MASGGPCTYAGRSMSETHRGMGVTAGEFDALVEDLVATLNQFGVPQAEQSELLGILGPLRGDIVEVESSDTGVPLPTATSPLHRLPSLSYGIPCSSAEVNGSSVRGVPRMCSWPLSSATAMDWISGMSC